MTLAHIIFLLHFRSILIVTLPLPVSILISFILMKQFGITSNIMSLTGIAIAIGVLVDAAIVMTENVIRHCEQRGGSEGQAGSTASRDAGDVTLEASQAGRPADLLRDGDHHPRLRAGVRADRAGGKAVPSARLHQDLRDDRLDAARGDARAGAVHACSCAGRFMPRSDNWVMRCLLRLYDPVLDWALRHRKTVLGLRGAAAGVGAAHRFRLAARVVQKLRDAGYPRLATASPGIGSEFMPPLNEGSLLFMPVLLPSTSLTEVKRIMAWQDQVIAQTPEVASSPANSGRSETATDPAPVEMIETTIMLKPETSQWRARA